MSDTLEFRLPPYAGPLLRPATFKSLDGGRDAAKSHTAAQIMLMRMAGVIPAYKPRPVRIVSCRDFNTNLKHSVKVAGRQLRQEALPARRLRAAGD